MNVISEAENCNDDAGADGLHDGDCTGADADGCDNADGGHYCDETENGIEGVNENENENENENGWDDGMGRLIHVLAVQTRLASASRPVYANDTPAHFHPIVRHAFQPPPCRHPRPWHTESLQIPAHTLACRPSANPRPPRYRNGQISHKDEGLRRCVRDSPLEESVGA